ncbi:MAG: immunoglobulin-like domain-containing protein, partial [Anaeroplasmataceae bacterium]
TVSVVDAQIGSDAMITSSDYNTELSNAPTSEEVLKEQMQVSAFDADGTDLLAEVEVISLDGYEYANPKVGTYDITFGVMGTNGANVSETSTLTVLEDGSTIYNAELVGNSPIDIKTNDGTTVSEITELINPQVIEYTDGEITNVIDEGINLLSDGGYDNSVEGSYQFVYEFTTENNLTVSNNFEVIVDDANETTSEVTITADNPTTIVVNSMYDPMISSNPNAISTTDGDITQNIEVLYNNVDMSTVGTYQVMYYAKDSVNAEAYLTIDVEVIDNIDGDNATLVSSDTTVELQNAPKTDPELIEAMNVSAYDTDGSDITDKVTVIDYGNYDVSNPQIGEYNITYSVSGTNGVIITKTSILKVIANDTDDINGEIVGNNPINVLVNDGTTDVEITTLIEPQLFEYLNGELESISNDTVTLVSTGGYDNTKEGTYIFVYEAITSDNQIVESAFTVNVSSDIETDSDVIISADNPTYVKIDSYYDPITTSNVTATSTTDGDITNDVEVLYNNVDTSTEGIYTVAYMAMDSVNSVGYEVIDVEVVNASDANVQLVANDAQSKLSNAPVTDEELSELMNVSATEADGTDVSDQVSIIDYGNYDYLSPQIGIYDITYSIKGIDGVNVTKTRTLEILDDATLEVYNGELVGNTPNEVAMNDAN